MMHGITNIKVVKLIRKIFN